MKINNGAINVMKMAGESGGAIAKMKISMKWRKCRSGSNEEK